MKKKNFAEECAKLIRVGERVKLAGSKLFGTATDSFLGAGGITTEKIIDRIIVVKWDKTGRFGNVPESDLERVETKRVAA